MARRTPYRKKVEGEHMRMEHVRMKDKLAQMIDVDPLDFEGKHHVGLVGDTVRVLCPLYDIPGCASLSPPTLTFRVPYRTLD